MESFVNSQKPGSSLGDHAGDGDVGEYYSHMKIKINI